MRAWREGGTAGFVRGVRSFYRRNAAEGNNGDILVGKNREEGVVWGGNGEDVNIWLPRIRGEVVQPNRK